VHFILVECLIPIHDRYLHIFSGRCSFGFFEV
jgi:hypothetical protein